MCDFETATVEPTYVWMYGICDIALQPSSFFMGHNIAEFISLVTNLGGVAYFHNLAFDGKFIIDHLLNNGYTHVSDVKQSELKDNEFTTLISNMGKYYSITLPNVSFRDSYKLLPFALRALGETEEKGCIDYDAERKPDHKFTVDELKYMTSDLVIPAKALAKAYGVEISKLTLGSTALSHYKQTVKFDKLYKDSELYKEMRSAYKGGICYVNKSIQGRVLDDDIVSYDYNSMYPSVMLTYPLPVGPPMPFVGDAPITDISVYDIIITGNVKAGRLPTLGLSSGLLSYDYDKELCMDRLMVTSIDLEMLKRNYDADIKIIGGYSWLSKMGLFDDYFKHWREVKESSTGIVRTHAKLMMNSLYGKFGSRVDNYEVVPYIKDEKISLKIVKIDDKKGVYLPMAMFITAYARRELERGISANYDRFLYCDTDSMYLLGKDPPIGVNIHDTQFLAWSLDGEYNKALFRKAKNYAVRGDHGDKIVCAGLHSSVASAMTFDEYATSTVIKDGAVRAKTVQGGVIITRSDFHMIE